MFCPQCDRVYLKAKVCPHCGVKLLRATGKPEKKPIVPPKSAVRSTTEICCPRCNSRKYFVHEKEKNRVFLSGKSPVLAILMIVLYFYEKHFTKRVEYVCLDCGYEWN